MARGQFGYHGVYNSSPITLASGEGSAAALTANGYTIVANPDGSSIGSTIVSGDASLYDYSASVANWQVISVANIPAGAKKFISMSIESNDCWIDFSGTASTSGNTKQGIHLANGANLILSGSSVPNIPSGGLKVLQPTGGALVIHFTFF